MPNPFAYLVLLSWPLVALVLFRTMAVPKALIWTVVAGHLILPSATAMKLPILPHFDKTTIVSVSAFVLCLLFGRTERAVPAPGSFPARALIGFLLALCVLGPVATVLTNREPLFYGPLHIPGLGIRDLSGTTLRTLFELLPFLLGLRYLTTPESHATLLKALVLGALVYTIPTLVELRLSPQLHAWVYGFFPHSFIQHMREGGYRPLVFLGHGLVLGIFFCLSVIASLVLFRMARQAGGRSILWLAVSGWLLVILILSKNFGALVICLLVGGLVLLTGRRVQVLFAVTVAAVVLLYPMLRGAGWIPVEAIQEFVEDRSADRADSLAYRLRNEDDLLDRANEKPLFGWGNWGRNHIYDPSSGDVTSVTDGVWVIFIGAYGWIGYVGRFGLLTLPIFLYAFHRRKTENSTATLGLCMIMAAILIDLIPNSALVNYVWLCAGAIAGHVLMRQAHPPEPQASIVLPPDAGAVGTAEWLVKSGTGRTAGRRSRRAELSR